MFDGYSQQSRTINHLTRWIDIKVERGRILTNIETDIRQRTKNMDSSAPTEFVPDLRWTTRR